VIDYTYPWRIVVVQVVEEPRREDRGWPRRVGPRDSIKDKGYLDIEAVVERSDSADPRGQPAESDYRSPGI
jgi:hypothetical protein